MINQFHLIGRVNVLSKDNPDYPGIYLELFEETKELVPISFSNEVLQRHLNVLSNGDVVGIKGRVSMKDSQVVLIAERVTVISRTTGKIVNEMGDSYAKRT
jgi:RNase P/RNase MRP subunit p29